MYKLVDLVDLIPGHPFRGKIPEAPESRVRVVQMKDVASGQGVSWDNTLRTIIAGKRQPDWLRTGDVLFQVRGKKNLAVHLDHVPLKAVCSPHFFLLRVKPEAHLLPEFLAWQLNQNPAQRYFEKAAEGSRQVSIRKPLLAALPLTAPEIETQKKVAALAELVRIEADALKKLIKNREQMLQALANDLLG